MKKQLQNDQIAQFALNARYEDIGDKNIDQLKRHLLDALGSAMYATNRPTVKKLVRQLEALSGEGPCKVPLLKGLPYDRAAQLYTALIRYPDFMDNFLGKEATCHPSDNIGPLLAVGQMRKTSGREFLTAMAVAYQVECRLVLEIPVMKEGIDHTLLLAYSAMAGVANLMQLTEKQTAHALGISGTSISPMVTSRAAYTFEWKGFASSLDDLCCVNFAFLAREGMTGPVAVFEGPKGFEEVFGMKLDYDWSKETFELIPRCILKRYNAEVHTQTAIDTALAIKKQHQIDPAYIEHIQVITFLTAYHITGSGAYGNRKIVKSKEQADHSLFYVVAAALLDDDLYPESFEPERIQQKDVQELLQRIDADTSFPIHKPILMAGLLDPYTEAYPDKVIAKVTITMKNGEKYTREQTDHPGFFTRPFGWEEVIAKFRRLCSGIIDSDRQDRIIELVRGLEHHDLSELVDLISIEAA